MARDVKQTVVQGPFHLIWGNICLSNFQLKVNRGGDALWCKCTPAAAAALAYVDALHRCHQYNISIFRGARRGTGGGGRRKRERKETYWIKATTKTMMIMESRRRRMSDLRERTVEIWQRVSVGSRSRLFYFVLSPSRFFFLFHMLRGLWERAEAKGAPHGCLGR